MCWVMPPASPAVDVGAADGVEQRGLAVVDVAHDGHDRRPRQQILRVVGDVEQAFLDVGGGHALDRVAELFGDELGRVGVDHVGDLVHLALLHQQADDVDGAFRHAVGELLDGDRLGNRDLADELLLAFIVGDALEALHAAAERGDRTLAHLAGIERGDDREAAAVLLRAAAAWDAVRARAAPDRRPPPRRGRGASSSSGSGTTLRRLSGSGAPALARAGAAAAAFALLSSSPKRFLASCSALRLASSSWRRRSSSSRLRASAFSRSVRSTESRSLRRRASSSATLRSSASRTLALSSALCSRLALLLGELAQDDAARRRLGGRRRSGRGRRAAARRGQRLARRAGPACGGRRRGAASALVVSGRRLLTFSTTTALVRPWLKLCLTTPCSTPGRLSVRVALAGVTVSFSPGCLVSVIPIPNSGPLGSIELRPRRPARPAGNWQGFATARGPCRWRGRQAAQHVPHLDAQMPNPIALT